MCTALEGAGNPYIQLINITNHQAIFSNHKITQLTLNIIKCHFPPISDEGLPEMQHLAPFH